MWGAGRIAGISGVLGGLFSSDSADDKLWRLAFLAGLILCPLILVVAQPELKLLTFKTEGRTILIAGILVGIGTQLGNGCTSGHGVCGNARLSERSIVATITFMATGIVTVFLSKYLGLY